LNHTTNRLADPRLPLSVDEDRDYRTVKALVYFLRVARKQVSRRIIEAHLKLAGMGMRHDVVCAYLRRENALERLKNQYGDQAGTARGPHTDKLGTAFEHAGDHLAEKLANRMGTENRVSSLTANINKNVGNDDATNIASDGKQPMASRPLREPTPGEARVLSICCQWAQGVSIPMPADIVELYRTMRPLHNLPTRPGI
jgi:hypothetical protein